MLIFENHFHARRNMNDDSTTSEEFMMAVYGLTLIGGQKGVVGHLIIRETIRFVKSTGRFTQCWKPFHISLVI